MLFINCFAFAIPDCIDQIGVPQKAVRQREPVDLRGNPSRHWKAGRAAVFSRSWEQTCYHSRGDIPMRETEETGPQQQLPANLTRINPLHNRSV